MPANYEHFSTPNPIKTTTMQLDNKLIEGASSFGGTANDIENTNKHLTTYIESLSGTLQVNAAKLHEDSKQLRNNQQTLLNQSDSIGVKSHYYDTKYKQNEFSVEKNRHRQNIFRMLIGLNIVMLLVILFIINKG